MTTAMTTVKSSVRAWQTPIPSQKILFLVITMNKNYELWKKLTGKTIIATPKTTAPKCAYYQIKSNGYWK